jgi:putative transposase
MRYRRAKIHGGTYFFTIVTYNREKIFINPSHAALLKNSFEQIRIRHPFEIDAFVILPDHLHCMLTLPQGDARYPLRMRMIKSHFSRKYPGGSPESSSSRIAKGEKAVWQRRYWEHLIRDEEDYARHVEYIHYNPVRHGLAKSPRDWQWSSFHDYVGKGVYDINWGAGEEVVFGEGVGSE